MNPTTNPPTGELVHDHARECTISKNHLNEDCLISEQQRTAIELLVLGRPLGEIARNLKIVPSTLYRWRQDELFQSALQQRRSEIWGTAAQRLKDLVHPSLEVLAEHLADRYDRARFRAANTVLRLVNLKREVEEDEM